MNNKVFKENLSIKIVRLKGLRKGRVDTNLRFYCIVFLKCM